MREALKHQGGEEGERFKMLMGATDKKLKLEKRRTMIEERKAAREEEKLKSRPMQGTPR